MYIFLITFLALYGGMHLYAFVKLRNSFRPGPYLTSLLIFWMMLMTIAPLLVRFAEQFGKEETARLIAWPGYLWMGFIFIFSSTLLFTDAFHLCYRFIVHGLSRPVAKYLSSRNFCIIALSVATGASVYAYFEADQIRTEHVVIASAKLSAAIPRIRIVQISDVHIGLLMQENRLQRIINKVREAGPDIVVSTGDLVDGKLNRSDAISEFDPLAALLASIPAPSGKFAVTGNHEVYAGLHQAVAFSQAAGFTMLRNRSIALKCGITLSGIDDRAVNPGAQYDPDVEKTLLNSVAPDSYNILLKHRPDILPESDGRFDLQLSGHVHGGQIFPFNFLVRLKYLVPCGTTKTQKGSRIHVSRGTGTWGPPMRLFVPPEVTIIDIVKEQPVN